MRRPGELATHLVDSPASNEHTQEAAVISYFIFSDFTSGVSICTVCDFPANRSETFESLAVSVNRGTEMDVESTVKKIILWQTDGGTTEHEKCIRCSDLQAHSPQFTRICVRCFSSLLYSAIRKMERSRDGEVPSPPVPTTVIRAPRLAICRESPGNPCQGATTEKKILGSCARNITTITGQDYSAPKYNRRTSNFWKNFSCPAVLSRHGRWTRSHE